MSRLLEKMVNTISNILFNEPTHKREKNEVKKSKDIYTLSSVFPSVQIMKEVEKYL